MNNLINTADYIPSAAPTPVISISPLVLPASGRAVDLELKISAPSRVRTFLSFSFRMAMASRCISPPATAIIHLWTSTRPEASSSSSPPTRTLRLWV